MMIIPPNTAEVMEKPMNTPAWELNETERETEREIKHRAITSTLPQERTGFFVFSLSRGETLPTSGGGGNNNNNALFI